MTLPLSPEAMSLHALTSARASSAPRVLPTEILELLYRHMRVLAGPRSDIDDLVQAAALRLIRVMPRFEGRSSLSTFAYGVAYRTLLGHDRWYRRWSRRFTLYDECPGESDDGPHESAEGAIARGQRAASLHRALAALPAPKRAVIVLHDLEGVDLRDVAEIVGSNERTVRSRLRDGRKKLATLLETDPAFEREAP
ncbi:MAG TPA: RNA polymerase sigma factor [Polyangiaceae bacterium]|nr:RNA polymerase sigma factor [Polyangiaceae bacterium]